jgi:hypothetical protein
MGPGCGGGDSTNDGCWLTSLPDSRERVKIGGVGRFVRVASLEDDVSNVSHRVRVTAHDVSVALYRLRVGFGRRWPGYVAVALTVALVGGLGLGALTMARRTQSSFPAFLRSTNPSDLSVVTEFDPDLLANIAALPGVTSAKTVGVPNVSIETADIPSTSAPPGGTTIAISEMHRMCPGFATTQRSAVHIVRWRRRMPRDDV